MRYMPEEVFEEFVKNLQERFPDVGTERVRLLAKESLKEQGIAIGLPLIEKIRQAQVHAGEQVVINNLRANGLLDPNFGKK